MKSNCEVGLNICARSAAPPSRDVNQRYIIVRAQLLVRRFRAF